MSLKNHTINMIDLTFGTSGKATVDELIDTINIAFRFITDDVL